MSFVTLVAFVTFLISKTSPSPLVRWGLHIDQNCPNPVSKLTSYDNRKLNSVQVSARGMSPQRWQLAQCSTFCEGDIITSRAKIQEQFSTMENLQCLEKIQDKFSISLQDSAMCLKFCQKDPACNFYKVENKHNDVMIIHRWKLYVWQQFSSRVRIEFHYLLRINQQKSK